MRLRVLFMLLCVLATAALALYTLDAITPIVFF